MSTEGQLENRVSRRQNLELLFKVTEINLNTVHVGKVSDVSTSGFCMYPGKELPIGTDVRVESAFDKPIGGFEALGKVVWQKQTPTGLTCGIKVLEVDERGRKILDTLDESFKKPRAFLKVILAVGVPAVPIAAFTLAIAFPRVGAILFASLISALILERLWETFFTSKESKAMSSSEDWTIAAVSFYYLLAYYLSIVEFYVFPSQARLGVSYLGLSFLVISFMLRWWGMKTLGDQWAVHATDPKKLQSQRRLVRTGPYGLCRHPIYLAVILELLAIPLIANSWAALVFVVVVNVPLQVLRARLEERKAFEVFGLEYLTYKKETPGFFPFFK